MRQEALIPKVGVVTDIRQDTPDVKTFRVVGLDGNKLFEHMPGQCAMVSIPGIGEGMFSITSSPTNKEFMEFSIKKCGCLTSWLHMMEVGQEVTVRGPLGKNFPVETVPTPENGNYGLKGKDLLFIAGGIVLSLTTAVTKSVRIRTLMVLCISFTVLVPRTIWLTIRRSWMNGARTARWI